MVRFRLYDDDDNSIQIYTYNRVWFNESLPNQIETFCLSLTKATSKHTRTHTFGSVFSFSLSLSLWMIVTEKLVIIVSILCIGYRLYFNLSFANIALPYRFSVDPLKTIICMNLKKKNLFRFVLIVVLCCKYFKFCCAHCV